MRDRPTAESPEQAPFDELIFLVEEAPEGGFSARALGESVFTETETLQELDANARDAVRCHFDEGQAPRMIRVRLRRG